MTRLSNYAFACLLLPMACSSSHERPNPLRVNDAAVDSSFDAAGDASQPGTCLRVFPESAFVPDALRNVRAGGTIVVDRPRRRTRAESSGALPVPEYDGAPIRNEDEAGNCGNEASVGYAWDGHRCRRVRAAYCQTEPCFGIYALEEECGAVHRSCKPEMCRSSGGAWTEFNVSCSRYLCGVLFGDCDGPREPQCVCPAGSSPNNRGACEVDLRNCDDGLQIGCQASGGRWDTMSCGDYQCGEQSPDACIRPGCDCGPMQVFDRDTARCMPNASCAGHSLTELCEWSGGTWDASASEILCGVVRRANGNGACNCGATSIFDETKGCLLAPYCRTNVCF